MTKNITAYIWNWDAISNKSLFALADQLPNEDISKLNDYERINSKLEYLTGRFLLRTLLSDNYSLPFHIELKISSSGKPFIDHGPEFNISHSNRITFLGFSESQSIGVDVETKSKTRNIVSIAKFYGTRSELDSLTHMSKTEQESAFYRIWSLKEAYCKATGQGINIDLKNLQFDFEKNKITGLKQESPYSFICFEKYQASYAICQQLDSFESNSLEPIDKVTTNPKTIGGFQVDALSF